MPDRWSRILVHHSATSDGPLMDTLAIRRYHTAQPPYGRGWSDIGYHWIIERVGSLYSAVPGRPESRAGSHCPGQNSIALGVCVCGNFAAAPPPAAQLEALTVHLVDLVERWRIPEEEIHGHRDHRQTECPGDALYAYLPELRLAVGRRRTR